MNSDCSHNLSREICHDFSDFTPEKYLREYYAQLGTENLFLLRELDSFYTAHCHGGSLLDIGSGPTIYQLLSASLCVDAIYIAEYLAANRSYLRNWLNDGQGGFSWQAYYDVVAGYHCLVDGRAIERALREKIKDITAIDILDDGTLNTSLPALHDVVSSSFCAESICSDRISFERALDNICGHVKPGGLLVMLLIRDAPFYHAGDKCFPAFPVNEEVITGLLEARNFAVKRMAAVDAEPGRDYTGLIFCGASKNDN